MKNLLKFLFISFLIISCSGSDEEPANTIFVGNYTVNTQQKANDFNFTEITGILIIQGAGITDISNLSGLTYVGEGIKVVETSLITLSGLENVTNDNGSPQSMNFTALTLSRNPLLEDVSALSEYSRSTTGLLIQDNTSLTSAGLQQLHVNKDVYYLEILRNPLVTNLSFLSDMETAEGRFWIGYLPNLTSLDGLDNLRSMTEPNFSLPVSGLWLTTLPSLQSLEGLNSLQTSSRLYFIDLPLITNLDALSSLTNGTDGFGTITIRENSSLTDFCGIHTYANSIEIYQGRYHVAENSYNPTLEQIRSITECSL